MAVISCFAFGVMLVQIALYRSSIKLLFLLRVGFCSLFLFTVAKA